MSSASPAASNSLRPILIDMWSDFVCPFCYIGKRKLEVALKELGYATVKDVGEDFDFQKSSQESTTATAPIAFIRYRAFELDPTSPPMRDESIAVHLSKKYGMPQAAALANLEGMRKESAKPGVDLNFNYENIKLSNTFDAHRILHYASEVAKTSSSSPSSSSSSAFAAPIGGVASAVKERFLKAYFTDAMALGDPSTLQKLSEECGLDGGKVKEILSDKSLFAKEVRSDEAEARSLGISGVPFFRLNRSNIAINGAQSPDQMKEKILRAQAQK